MRKFAFQAFAIGLVALSAAQLVQPTASSKLSPRSPRTDLLQDQNLDPQVRTILRRACADCHSNQTHLPWYARVSPVSWLITRHIEQGRQKLNFSEWPQNSANQKQDIADSIDKAQMPLPSYLFLHPQAQLSTAEKNAIERWADSSASRVDVFKQ